MRGWKRLFYYLTINVLVSACTMIVVLAVWQHYNPIQSGVGQIPFFSKSNPTRLTPVVSNSGSPSGTEDPLLEGTELPSEDQLTPSQPPRGKQEYRTQAGDTLGAIAVEFGVTVDEIMRANDLTDPDQVDVGVVLIIPGEVQELPTLQPPAEETPTPTVTLTASASGTPGERPPPTSGTAGVVIESVVGAGDLASERVLLKRTGSGELSLAGWQLVEKGGKSFIFPQLTLFEGGAVNVYTKAGQATVVSLYWGLKTPVWESGGEVILLDNQGVEHATYTVP